LICINCEQSESYLPVKPITCFTAYSRRS